MKQILLIILLALGQLVLAQTKKVCLVAIDLVGHKKTKDNLIYNELDIAVGDSLILAELMPAMKRNERYLFNTALFQRVKIKIKKWEGADVSLEIQLKEAWYIIPIPQFELADRNFNVWWVQQNRDIRRVNIGLWFIWRNLSGYNDYIKTVIQFGYTRKFELDYHLPPMGRKRKFGFSVNALYSDNSEVHFLTQNNKQVFYSDFDSPQRQYQRIRARVRAYYRRTLTETHRLGLGFLQLSVSDSVVKLNPDYFLDNKTQQRSFRLRYTYTLDQRDIQIYPLSGYYIHGELDKRGLGIFKDVNQLQLYLQFGYYIPVTKWLNIGTELKGRYSIIRDKVSFYNNKALGYLQDYVRGYQYYVIDGQDFFLWQTDVNFKIVKFKIPLFKKIPIYYLQELPVILRMRTHLDFGYVWDYYYSGGNPLANTELIGFGVGVDVILYNYNVIFQLEYSFNKSGENGLYLRYKFHF